MRFLMMLATALMAGCSYGPPKNPFNLSNLPSSGGAIHLQLPGPPRGRACFAMGPTETKRTFEINNNDVICDHTDTVFMILDYTVTSGAPRVYLQDYGQGKFMCHLDTVCPVNSPGLFVGTIRPTRVKGWGAELELVRTKEPPLLTGST